MRLNYAIVHVSDMKRSVAFYRDVVGLTLRFESPGRSEFATDGATLAFFASGDAAAPPNDQSAAAAGRCRPGLAVPNLDEFHRRMIEKGVPCVHEPKETFGARIAQYADRDGLVISISEERLGR